MASPSLLLQLFLLSLALTMTSGYSGKVLLVSFDGFRWDYLNNIPGLVNFQRLKSEGVSVPFMNNTFSTVTFPNHYSIATGLYQESHGIVQNRMYDPEFDAWFSMGNLETRWWDEGEPVWITAVKQGKKSGAYHWAGSEVELQGLRPTYYTAYNASDPWASRVDTVMSWFEEGGIDVGLLYYHEPDETGHNFGVDSPETIAMVQEVDAGVGYLLDQMDEKGLIEEMNLIILSDHGMADTDFERVIDLYTYVDPADIDVTVDMECVCLLQAVEGRRDAVISSLRDAHPRMVVYDKLAGEVPQRWFYTDNRRILDIVVVMEEGYQCVAGIESNPWLKFAKGNHGWDNEGLNMKPIFLAAGPDFKQGYEPANTLRNIDVYPLICELTGITPAPNNGSLSNTMDMLRDPENHEETPKNCDETPQNCEEIPEKQSEDGDLAFFGFGGRDEADLIIASSSATVIHQGMCLYLFTVALILI